VFAVMPESDGGRVGPTSDFAEYRTWTPAPRSTRILQCFVRDFGRFRTPTMMRSPQRCGA
jgi:hypothetical protein